MSPYYWWYNSSSSRNANVFIVYNDGRLGNDWVNDTDISVRPIPFYNSHIWLRLNIVELRYKIIQSYKAKNITLMFYILHIKLKQWFNFIFYNNYLLRNIKKHFFVYHKIKLLYNFKWLI